MGHYIVMLLILIPLAMKAQGIKEKQEDLSIESRQTQKEIAREQKRVIKKPITSLELTPQSDSIEKIRVIGSRIKRIDAEGSSPIIVINREEIKKTGYNSIADILRDLTINSFGSRRESPGNISPGAASVSLRGLGADKTLVLIDGKRTLKDPYTNASDLNLIPLVVVERVEILKDSASSIYGSDALGGVVNIVTRKNFNSHEVSVKQFVSEGRGGNQTEVGLTSGYSNRRLSLTGVLYHRSNDAIYAENRKHSELRVSSFSAPGDFRILKSDRKSSYMESDSKTPSPRSLPQAFPSCPSDRIVNKFGGSVCQDNYADRVTNRPDLKQTSAMLNANFKVNESLNTFFRLSGTHRDVKWAYAPTPIGSFSGHGISGKQAKTYMSGHLSEVFKDLQDDDFVEINYRLMELGDRMFETATDQYSTLTGITMDIGETWEIEFSMGHSRSLTKNVGVNGYVRSKDIQQRLDTGFNPFAPSPGDLSGLEYQTWTTSVTDLTLVEVSASGEIYEMLSGPLGMAVGTQAHREIFRIDADEATKNDEIIGGTGSELGGVRNVFSGYMELSVPLTSSLEWGLSGRYDAYSDFGQALSPKTSVRWQVSPEIIVRSSVGRGFKAPNMDALYEASSHGFRTFIDHVYCKKNGGSACRPRQWKVVSGGNTELEEEKSLSTSLGTVIAPTNNIVMSIDGWYVKLENQVGINLEDVTRAEERFGSGYIESFGIHIDRDSTGRIIKAIAPTQNLSKVEISGIDLASEFSVNTKLGDFLFGTHHSHLFYNKTVGFPGLEKKNILGQSGFPPWRNTVSLTYSPTNNQAGSLTARTVATHEKKSPKAGSHRQYTEFDLQYTYNGFWSGSFSVGVRNLLGTTPPVDDSNPNLPLLPMALYDGNGRIGWVQYNQRF